MIRAYRASVESGRSELSVSQHRFSGYAASSILMLRIAALAVAGSIGVTAPAQAASYWSDDDSGYYDDVPVAPPHAQRARRHPEKKTDRPVKEAAKPQGPLIIAISISKQQLKLYDANGLFAETPISTGMRGHTTPMGVFSVIQKQKYHKSNIYSGAPMPYMQRITWSGIAMHAGVLPGYPASHGCIRMPMTFAVKMYGWTRMGARVVVTPGEIAPASFSHPLLVTQKVVPQPAATDESKTDVSTNASDKGDKAAANNPTGGPATPDANLELRSSVDHNHSLQAAVEPTPVPPPLSGQTHTADAALPGEKADTMSDASPSGAPVAAQPGTAIAASDEAASPAASAGVKSAGVTTAETRPGATADVSDAKKDQGQLSDAEKPAAPKAGPVAASGHKRSSPISVFISRKDSKLYVRQDFAPLFDAPVTIAPSDRPLGTHIFTAEADKNDANILHWSVISLPSRNAARHDEDDERTLRRRKIAGTAEIKPIPIQDSPAEALDRLTIPADVMARITEGLSTGSSIIISDQGIAAGETGEGTEFIVSLR